MKPSRTLSCPPVVGVALAAAGSDGGDGRRPGTASGAGTAR
jgi:hypothetical protein